VTPQNKPHQLHQSYQSSYLHYCSNETVHGIQFQQLPDNPHNSPLIADMSSDFLSKEININDYGMIYAGAQKNVGPSGLGIVIIKDDLLHGEINERYIPTMLDYKVHADNRSMYNTPPCFPIYMAGLVFDWLLAQGGLSKIQTVNEEKADLIYKTIDESNGFYKNFVAKNSRSVMNIPFYICKSDGSFNQELINLFIEQAKEKGLLALKGHKAVGGIRASIYNAMSLEGCLALSNFMKQFMRENISQ
jgi:phosphoserine aminotransferase